MKKLMKEYRRHLNYQIEILKLSKKQGSYLRDWSDYRELERDYMDDKISNKEFDDYINERIEYHKFKI